MHEMSIAQAIIDNLEEEQRIRGFRRITRVEIRLGEFSNIVPESLSFCFDASKAGTIAADAELHLTIISLQGACTDCGKVVELREDYFLCPHCGSFQVAVLSGEELDLVSIDVE